jgi:hypothetical protein
MIYIAYDGSLNGDWVSRYAIRMASHSPQKKLVLVHIFNEQIPAERLQLKTNVIEAECRARQVELISRTHYPLKQGIFHSLTRYIPEGEDTICVCGTRVSYKKKGYLAGTISAKLLRHHRFNVLAVRVVQPGMLGNPRRFLVPLAGHPRKFESAYPFFRLFTPDIEEVYLLRVMAVSIFRFHNLSLRQTHLLRRSGRTYIDTVAADIAKMFRPHSFYLDSRVLISDDWPKEILMFANQLRVRMILLGASERTLPARFFYYENALERILEHTPCDVGIYRSL